MAEKTNIKKCKQLVSTLKKKVYFKSALAAYNKKYNQIVQKLVANGEQQEFANKKAYRLVLSQLHDIMREAQPLIEDVINSRIENGEISDASQARKSVAGNLFQQFVAYTLAQNILVQNINKDVIVSLSSNVLDEYAVIDVGEDKQKPDSDVLVYSESNNSPIINFSCKTSCRERAGQTYKWKLLSDLACCNCEHKHNNENCPVTKYSLHYEPKRKILMYFITADFYNELSNPQIVAMFNFFDNSYVAKPHSSSEKIKTLEYIIDDINTIY